VRPIRLRDRAAWREVRARNVEWLRPWEATLPPGSFPASVSFAAMVRDARRSGRAGHALPFVITYDGQLAGQVTVTGVTWGSARWGQVGYWIDHRLAGRGVAPVPARHAGRAGRAASEVVLDSAGHGAVPIGCAAASVLILRHVDFLVVFHCPDEPTQALRAPFHDRAKNSARAPLAAAGGYRRKRISAPDIFSRRTVSG